MDDLKLYERNDEELEGLLKTANSFSDDISAECAKVTFK